MADNQKLPTFASPTPLHVVTRSDCSPAAWELMAQMTSRIADLQQQLRKAHAVICQQQGHLPISGSGGTWCELCHQRLDPATTTQVELRFEDLPEDLQWCARTRFIDAGKSIDPYFYLVSSRRELISRNRVRQLTPAEFHKQHSQHPKAAK